MSYREAMEFGNKTIDFTDRKTGKTNPWRVNHRLCKLAREFHGGYNWKGSDNFRRMVRINSGTWNTNFWGRSLHGLGNSHEEIFSFFTDYMNDKTIFKFAEYRIETLVEFWIDVFKEQLKYIGEINLLSKYSDKDFASAYYYVIANTVQGILDEQNVLDNLKKMFEYDSSISVEFGSKEDDYNDIDIIIKKKDKVWHKVSVKSDYSFTVETILSYRSGSDYKNSEGKKDVTVYCDQHLNRLFFRKGEMVPYKMNVVKNNPQVEQMIQKWGLNE